MKYHWMDEIQIEDLDPDLAELAEEFGLRLVLGLLERLEGGQKYFRKIKTSLAEARNRLIRRKWNGYNLHDLAVEFDLTDRMIREIVRDDERQVELFPQENSLRAPNASPGETH